MTDTEAVNIMLSTIYESLDSLKNSHSALYENDKFLRWALITSINLTCRFAKVGKIDIETLLKNVKQTMELLDKTKSKIIPN
jgi:hypothetical protein